jgi:O-methyltransferase involved in polyketide biosynthesis
VHDPSTPTSWIWEGVVPYLERDVVEATVEAIAARSAPGSTLVTAYQVTGIANTVGRRAAQLAARLARRADPLADEPRRSLWSAEAMRRLLHERGLQVREDRDLLATATEIGSPTRHGRTLRAGRVVVADAPH